MRPTTQTFNSLFVVVLAWFALIACIDARSVFAGKLGAVRDAVRSNDSAPSPKKKDRKRSKSHHDRDCDDDDFNWVTIFLSDSSDSNSSSQSQSSQNTSTSYASAHSESITRAINEDHWFSRLSLFGGSDSETLKHGGFSWLCQLPGSFGLDLGATSLRESDGSLRETMWLGDVNVVFEPILGPVRGRIGVGINWLNDSFGTESGGNITAGFDLPVFAFLITTGEIDFGSIGDADYTHGQITLGAQLGGAEVFAGYNKYEIGGVDLDGTIFGLRIRL